MSLFFRRKSARQIIADNFEIILDRTDYFQLNKLLEILMKNSQTSDIVKEKFDTVIKRFYSTQDVKPEYRDAGLLGAERVEFYRTCKKTYTYADDLIKAHMDTITQGEVTIEELQELKLSEETNEKLNAKLESQKQEVAREMLSSIPLEKKTIGERQQLISDYIPTIARIIYELRREQNARMVDIEKIGRGGYSKV